MKKLVIITNIPSPYRVDFFYYLQENIRDYEIHILYASRNEDNRAWEIDESKMRNSHFLDSWTLKIPRRYDTKYIHISKGVAAVLKKLQPAVVVGSEYNPTILQAVKYCSRYQVPYVSWTDGTLYSERNISGLQKKTETLCGEACRIVYRQQYQIKGSSDCLWRRSGTLLYQLPYGRSGKVQGEACWQRAEQAALRWKPD